MARILVVGPVNWDFPVSVLQLPRPGDTVEGCFLRGRLGGSAANTAVGLASMGHEVRISGCIGSDVIGKKILSGLGRYHIDTSLIKKIPGPSFRTLVFLDPTGDRAIVLLGGALMERATADLWNSAYDAIYVAIARSGIVPLLASAPSGVMIFACFPPSDVNEWMAHVLIGSEKDVSLRLGEREPFEVFSRLTQSKLQHLIVTKAAHGATVYSRKETINIPARQVAPVDTTGAGDALTAGVIGGGLNGQTLEQALQLGVKWGTESALILQSVPA